MHVSEDGITSSRVFAVDSEQEPRGGNLEAVSVAPNGLRFVVGSFTGTLDDVELMGPSRSFVVLDLDGALQVQTAVATCSTSTCVDSMSLGVALFAGDDAVAIVGVRTGGIETLRSAPPPDGATLFVAHVAPSLDGGSVTDLGRTPCDLDRIFIEETPLIASVTRTDGATWVVGQACEAGADDRAVGFVDLVVDGAVSDAISFGADDDGWDAVRAIAPTTDGKGAIVVGEFSGDELSLANARGPSRDSFGQDGFVASLRRNGDAIEVEWLHTFGGPADEMATGVVVKDGSIFVAGTFSSGPTDLGLGLTDTAGRGRSAYVIALRESDGSLEDVWVGGDFEREVLPSEDYVRVVAVPTGVVIAGPYRGSTAFAQTEPTPPGATSSFVALLEPTND
jgi:hypothetical protein